MTTAVLVFAYSPSEELMHKPIPKADSFFNELTGHAIKTVKKSGLSYFHYTENEQKGSTFGERFSSSIQSIFNLGFDNVITIGNDSPNLKASQILRASEHLEKKDFVLGPSKDGGFYLMGIHRSQFNAQKFKNLPWQTNKTASALLALVKESNTKVFTLVTLTDLDCISDLKKFLKYSSIVPSVLINLILSIIGVLSQLINYLQNKYNRYYYNNVHNKGSPLVVII